MEHTVPPPPPKSETTLQHIQASWDEAQAQLRALREQVEHLNSLALAKVSSNVLERDLDRAFRDLGEAVWTEVVNGRLQLSSDLSEVRQTLEKVTQKIKAQNASINDLLAEGSDVADRVQEKVTSASKGVAPPKKKR
jgi:predicted  nucleic acid-binding Zn-ribbon protein